GGSAPPDMAGDTMGKVMDEISGELAEFIRGQRMFFVATAPLSANGHVNLSPKGLDTFRILSPTRVAYADMTGSGNETSAHLAENRRITLMFCSFNERPRILRIYGTGRTILRGDASWMELAEEFQKCGFPCHVTIGRPTPGPGVRGAWLPNSKPGTPNRRLNPAVNLGAKKKAAVLTAARIQVPRPAYRSRIVFKKVSGVEEGG